MSRRSSVYIALAMTSLALFAVWGVSSATAATPGQPAWSLTGYAYPTQFEAGSSYSTRAAAGPGYQIIAVNVGEATTSGSFAVEDVLPAGVRPSPAAEPSGAAGVERRATEMSCQATGQRVRCTASVSVRSGEKVRVDIPVVVEPGVTGTVADEMSIEGGGAVARGKTIETEVGPGDAPFGFLAGSTGLSTVASGPDGSVITGAGSHPYQFTVGLGFNAEQIVIRPSEPELRELLGSEGGVRDIDTLLPAGVVVNPQAVPTCAESQLESSRTSCPESSQIGVIRLGLNLSGFFPTSASRPLYNIAAPPGAPAVFGFEVLEGIYVHLIGRVRSDGQYELGADAESVLAKVGVFGAEVTLWGDPSDPIHDPMRGSCMFMPTFTDDCAVPPAEAALVTMPTACSASISMASFIDSWERPGIFTERRAEATDLDGNPVGIDGCNQLGFSPTIRSRATTDAADSPSGLEFELHQPQDEEYGGRSTAALRDTTVSLPEGMALNPSAAAGLAGCTTAQIGLRTGVAASPIRFDEVPQTCPNEAKVGTVEVSTPLLDHELTGSVYVARPFENPFGSLLAIYLAIEDGRTGIVSKLAGRVEPDPTTGQLTATFTENPQLPLEDIDLRFFAGARGVLTTPLSCGSHTTTSTLTPWSTPEGADAHPTDSFTTSVGCAASEGAAPRTVSFTAGTESPLSGSYSPFILRLVRPDGSQHITGIATTLPEGLLGRLAGVSYCPEQGIAQARSREAVEEGKLERLNPSCPASSEVGTVNVRAGSGIAPIPVAGHAYLAGPYKGAPLSLVVIVPAVAGPFDLGTVVNRVALEIGTFDARIHAVADPLPTIRDGIPLDVRSIELRLGRPGFTLNPTSCEAMAIGGSVTTQAGQTAALDNRFQVGECGRLAFKPRLRLSLKGATRRTGHPALRAVVTMPTGGANIARAQVGLPHSEFLDQGNLNNVCTRPLLRAGTCPTSSVYGHARAWTPLLDRPLEGPVYLGVGFGYKLPALVADLDGQVRILLVGRVDTTRRKGIRNTFEVVPDAPVSRFVLTMKGGRKYGLLENSENICRGRQRASARFVGQNGKVAQLRPRIANGCKKGKHEKRRRKGKHHHKGKHHRNGEQHRKARR